MAVDRIRTARGALAGAAAAAVWAAQQPLDSRVFGVRHDDIRMLGSTITRGPAAYPIGFAWHVGNGALFGALYANVAPSLPGPAAARGAAVALAEHTATWPLARLAHLHPAADDLPQLWGNRRAFAQGAWRHVLFGAVLGELERRLNPAPGEPEPVEDTPAHSNGHSRESAAREVAAAARAL